MSRSDETATPILDQDVAVVLMNVINRAVRGFDVKALSASDALVLIVFLAELMAVLAREHRHEVTPILVRALEKIMRTSETGREYPEESEPDEPRDDGELN